MTAIEFNHVSKMYQLGVVGTGTLSNDIKRWWTTSVLGKEDPFLKIGQTNDRSKKAQSDFVYALRDIDFKVEQGDVVGIIGKNGAGKSTLLKLLSRITAPTSGTIKARGRIASLLEVGTGFHPELTGRENIYMNGSIMGMTKHEIDAKLDEIIDFSGCEMYIDTPCKRYSSGMQVRLGFAVAAFLEPEILVVDEVLAVGDAEFQKKAIGKMQDVSTNSGRTVLFVSHNMDSMLNLCKNGVLLENGQVSYSGDIKSTVAEYLGGGNNDFRYFQNKSNQDIFISECVFLGNEKQNSGMFMFDENVSFQLKVCKKEKALIEKNLTISIYITTMGRTRICCTEANLSELQVKESETLKLTFPSSVIMPGKYMIHADIHVPNVRFYDRADLCVFSIFDNGTEFLKYNGWDSGLIMLRPEINIE